MEENNGLGQIPDINLTEYQNIDALAAQSASTMDAETEKKLEYLLLRIWFLAKSISTIAFIGIFLLTLYMWSRNQTQESWIMRQTQFVAQGNAVCNWVNGGNTRPVDKSTEFLDFLVLNQRGDLRKYIEEDRCLTPDTLSYILRLEEVFATTKLLTAYQTTVIKKFLGSTLESSDEISTILSFDPKNRMKHAEVLRLIAKTIKENTTKTNIIHCGDVRFQGISTNVSCSIRSVPPVQPRNEALKFLEKLEDTKDFIVSYPNSLDLSVDAKNNIMSTSFDLTLIYTPARYEWDVLNNI